MKFHAMHVRPNHKLYNKTPVIFQNLKPKNKQQQKHFCTPPATFLFHIKGGVQSQIKKNWHCWKLATPWITSCLITSIKINELGFACHKHHLNRMQSGETSLFCLQLISESVSWHLTMCLIKKYKVKRKNIQRVGLFCFSGGWVITYIQMQLFISCSLHLNIFRHLQVRLPAVAVCLIRKERDKI